MKKLLVAIASGVVFFSSSAYSAGLHCFDRCPFCKSKAHIISISDVQKDAVVVNGEWSAETRQGITLGTFYCERYHTWECLLGTWEDVDEDTE